MFAECTETVSILEALFFGAGDACINVSLWSILSAFGVFMVGVVILQILARRVWNGRRKRRDADEPRPAPRLGQISDGPYKDDPDYRDSAIRSSRR